MQKTQSVDNKWLLYRNFIAGAVSLDNAAKPYHATYQRLITTRSVVLMENHKKKLIAYSSF